MRKVIIFLTLAALAVGLASCCRPCRRAKPVEVKGVKWALVELQGKVIERPSGKMPENFTLTLGEDGRIGGRGDCNTYFAGYTMDSGRIEVAGIASTRMLCPDQDTENRFFRTLESAKRISIDGDYLILSDNDGTIVASFKRIG